MSDNGVPVSHLGAVSACKTAERKILLSSKARIVNLVTPGYNEVLEKYYQSERWHSTFAHAEEFETSAVLAIRPGLVDMWKAVREYPEHDPLFGPISIVWNEFCKSGVIGDATVATAEAGRAILEHVFEKSLKLIRLHQESLQA